MLQRLAILALLLSLGAALPAQQIVSGRCPLPGEASLAYLALPPPPAVLRQLQRAERRPGLILLLGGGSGTEATVRAALRHGFAGLPARGWLVVGVPVREELFFRGGEADIPALLAHLAEHAPYDPERVVVAGGSNGGTGALAVAAAHPEHITGVIAIPGHSGAIRGRAMAGLADLPVLLRAGGHDDTGWIRSVAQTAEQLQAAGARVDHAVLEDQGHMIELTTAELAAWLDAAFTPPADHE